MKIAISALQWARKRMEKMIKQNPGCASCKSVGGKGCKSCGKFS